MQWYIIQNKKKTGKIEEKLKEEESYGLEEKTYKNRKNQLKKQS